MRSETVTTIVFAPREKVFAYLAEIENLPKWATEFARELKREGDDYKVVNGLGEFYFQIRADATTGVIDMFAGPSKDHMAIFPTRAVSLPDGSTAYSFTMFQPPDMPDGLFESQYRSLQREFANIEAAFAETGRQPPIVHALEMPVDVQTEIWIDRSRAEVAAYACDPDNAISWYENIRAVEWKSPKPLAVGSRIAFVARFLGRRLEYTCEVKEVVAGERFVMATSEGPFPMETSYSWADSPGGGTEMTLRNRGQPTGFSKLAAPLIAAAMRRANRKDLQRLKSLRETAESSPG